MIRKLTVILALAAAGLFALPPYSGTIFNFPDSFRDTDPTALTGVVYAGQQQKRVYDRRAGNITINAYVYTAGFDDGAGDWSIMVNPEFTRTVADSLAAKYARNIGQMPHCIRAGVSGAVIHDGINPWGGGDPLTIHHGQGLEYERQGIVTETMIHESTHAEFDRQYYTSDWSAAASADGEFISTYARDNPTREDHSETFLCWFVARYKRDRISASDYAKISATVPNRLAWYDGRNFKLSPAVAGPSAIHAARFAVLPPPTFSGNPRKPALSKTSLGVWVERPASLGGRIWDMRGRLAGIRAPEPFPARP